MEDWKMRNKLSISIILASMLALMFISVDAQQGQGGGSGDRDQQMDRDYDRDMDRDRDYDRDMAQDRDYDRDMDQDRDQLRAHDQDKDQDRDRVQDRDRLHVTDPASLRDEDIYGSALMSKEELKQYRNQLMNMETVEAREQYRVQHEEMMQERAQKQGKDLVPPGQGPIYGGELMTVQERNEYREQLRHMNSDEEREKFQARHQEQMNLRAKALELDIEEAE
jgi:hypothetical protein